MRATFLVFLFAAIPAYSQDSRPQFDVASVKLSPPAQTGRRIPLLPRKSGGPGTGKPGRVTYQNYNMGILITEAYEVEWTQLSGPEWITILDVFSSAGRFDIEATMPPQTTREQFHLMLQRLLEERFGLQVRRDSKPGAVYRLVAESNGSKIKPAPPMEPADRDVPNGPKGPDGFPTMPPGYSGLFVNVEPALIHIKFMRYSMAEFSKWLWGQLKKPVEDHTGMAGVYDFYLDRGRDPLPLSLTGDAAAEPGGPELPAALAKQLGLRLVSEKGSIETLVIEKINRTPTAN